MISNQYEWIWNYINSHKILLDWKKIIGGKKNNENENDKKKSLKKKQMMGIKRIQLRSYVWNYKEVNRIRY